MKQVILLFAFLLAFVLLKGQTAGSRFTCATTAGMGIAVDEPSGASLAWRVLGYYHFSPRFSAGAGSGLSFYEKMLVPALAGAKFVITNRRRYAPYIECAAGYAFAPDGNANGGLCLSPAAGVEYALSTRLKLQFSAGYELQKSEQRKEYASDQLTVQFRERLNHHSVMVRLGVVFNQ